MKQFMKRYLITLGIEAVLFILAFTFDSFICAALTGITGLYACYIFSKWKG